MYVDLFLVIIRHLQLLSVIGMMVIVALKIYDDSGTDKQLLLMRMMVMMMMIIVIMMMILMMIVMVRLLVSMIVFLKNSFWR